MNRFQFRSSVWRYPVFPLLVSQVFLVFHGYHSSVATDGQLQLCRRGTEICTENKLFWNPREKWLAQLEKGVCGRLPAGRIENSKISQGRRSGDILGEEKNIWKGTTGKKPCTEFLVLLKPKLKQEVQYIRFKRLCVFPYPSPSHLSPVCPPCILFLNDFIYTC